jgi:hypothetical protein
VLEEHVRHDFDEALPPGGGIHVPRNQELAVADAHTVAGEVHECEVAVLALLEERVEGGVDVLPPCGVQAVPYGYVRLGIAGLEQRVLDLLGVLADELQARIRHGDQKRP